MHNQANSADVSHPDLHGLIHISDTSRGCPENSLIKIKRPGVPQQRISCHLPKMLQVAKWVNVDLLKGFTAPQVAQKHGWPESLVWSRALVNADDFSRFKALQWRIRTVLEDPCKFEMKNGDGKNKFPKLMV